ncbi:hypothetical protein FC34_GL000132 [Lacticaseibacillus brantae DSM 23927]|uniref:SGNH hydrolase-type esterase domain-containing protein n=1 Tax=Lacticaseibacillus brantae DSM 23927 TaxID=1423727 RepID=A0A0R2B9R5_9LACO|nr:hypothetical protein FC34_GL000132 [Lacticaseibacillus brantae DSM 23927]
MALGDSLAAGYYTTTEKNSYQYLVANQLKNQGYQVSLDGFWQAGATLQGFASPKINRVIAMVPDIITLEYGTNEQDRTNPNYASPKQYQHQLTSVIATLQAKLPKAKILVLTSWLAETAADYTAVVKQVAKQQHVTVVNLTPIWQETDNISTPATRSFQGQGDNYHPNDAGNRAIAKAIMAQLNHLLK